MRLDIHDVGELPAEWVNYLSSPERAAAMRASGQQVTDTSQNRKGDEMRTQTIDEIMTQLGARPADAAARSADVDGLIPIRARMLRDSSRDGHLPPELRASVADAAAAEAQMSPQQIRMFRDSHAGMSPTEFVARGGAQ